MERTFARIYRVYFAPISAEPDGQRREAILNVLLGIAILLSVTALVLETLDWIRLGSAYWGAAPITTLSVVVALVGLYATSRRGNIVIPSYVLIAVFYLMSTYCIYRWGVRTPEGILIYAFVIALAGILGSAALTLVSVGVVLASLFIIYFMVAHGIDRPDLRWINDPIRLPDIIVYALDFVILGAVSWFSKREIDHSLRRALDSERALREERDQLEVTVRERTQELRQAQRAEMLQLYELVEVGRMSTSLLHDLLNPLSSVTLGLELLPDTGSELVQRISRNGRRIEHFIEVARKQIKQVGQSMWFKPEDEIADALELLGDRIRQARLKTSVSIGSHLRLYGDPVKFYRVAINLISNSIDAYESVRSRTKRVIEISMVERQSGLVLTVRDYGVGIEPERAERAFEKYYSTKEPGKGSGLGLTICKEIVEQEFQGSISLAAAPKGGGTVVTALFGLHGSE